MSQKKPLICSETLGLTVKFAISHKIYTLEKTLSYSQSFWQFLHKEGNHNGCVVENKE